MYPCFIGNLIAMGVQSWTVLDIVGHFLDDSNICALLYFITAKLG